MGRGIFCAAVAVAVMALPAAANAAQVYQYQSGHRSNVNYVDTAWPAESNTVTAKVIMDGYGVLVTDSTATITTVEPDPESPSRLPCTLLDEHRALCVNATPHPEPIGGFPNAYLAIELGGGDNVFELDPETVPPELAVGTGGGDDVISVDNVVEAHISDFDGSNTIRVGRTQRRSSVRGGQGPDLIDVKNRSGGDIVACSWRDEVRAEGDRVRADRDDVVDADCGG